MDIATAQQQRIDFARVCVEVSASSNLPKVIQVRHGLVSVSVAIEYQWLPPKCELCKVFGHTCKPKVEVQDANQGDTWQQIGKALGGGGGVLEALSKEKENAPTGASFVMKPDKEGVDMDDLGEDTHSESSEDHGTLDATTGGSCSDPSLQPKLSGVIGTRGKDQITQDLAMTPSVNGSNKPPDPPDIKGGNNKKSNQKKHKKPHNGSKGGTSGPSSKGRWC